MLFGFRHQITAIGQQFKISNYAPGIAVYVAEDSIQRHGGIGMTWEPVRWLAD